ncbi:MAG: hypothetical protein WA118_02450 [Carboxydocellales bacterium]
MAQKSLTTILLIIIGLVLTGVIGYIAVSSQPMDTGMPRDKYDKPKPITHLQDTSDGQGMKQPMAVAVGDKGLIYVTDTGNNRVQVYRPNGKATISFGKAGSQNGEFNYPYGILALENGHLLVADTGNYRIQEFTGTGEFVKIWLPSGEKIKPGMMTMDNKGLVYISDLAGQQILVSDSEGKILQVIPGVTANLRFPQGLVVDSLSQIWVADGGSFRVKVINGAGELVKSLDGRGTLPKGSRFTMVRGLAMDNLGRIFVSESLANRIRVLDETGTELFMFSGKQAAGMLFPMGITIDQKSRIYIADRGNNRVQVWGYPLER